MRAQMSSPSREPSPSRARALVLGGLLATLALAVVALANEAASGANAAPSREIQVVLDKQISAWNRGDIPGFMEGYRNSPELIYLTDTKIIHGWQTLLEYYQQLFRPPNEASMGILSLPEEEMTMLGRDSAIVWGTYVVKTPDGHSRGGRYTLAMLKLPEGWRTIYDRTSVKALTAEGDSSTAR